MPPVLRSMRLQSAGAKAVPPPRRVPLALRAEIRLDIGDERIPAHPALWQRTPGFCPRAGCFRPFCRRYRAGGRDFAPGIFPRRFKNRPGDRRALCRPGEARSSSFAGRWPLIFISFFRSVFLQQRFRDERRCLAHEPVEPLPGVVPADGKSFIAPPRASPGPYFAARGAVKNAVAHADTTSAIGKHHHTLLTFPGQRQKIRRRDERHDLDAAPT